MKRRFCLLAGVIACIGATQLHAAAPTLTSYQGRVQVSGTNFNGTGQFKFALIGKPAGAALWSNDGTSVDGSEPAAAVSIGVSNGLFTVLLGDDSLANMLPLTADIFSANSDVCLRIWFNDGANGSVQLAPDTRVGSVPYALSADIADGSITPGKLNAASAPQVGRLLSYDGVGFDWVDGSVAGNIWSLNGTHAYYNAGNVGIGTTTPSSKLTIRSTSPVNAYGIEHTDGTVRLSTFIDSLGGWLGTRTSHDLNFYVNDDLPSLSVAANGNIVITPNGGTGGYGRTQFGTPNGESGLSIIGANRADLRFNGSSVKLVAGPGAGPPDAASGLAVTTGGNVGVGTDNPQAKLHVAGNVLITGTSEVQGNASVSGNANISGNAVQSPDQGGFVKAMAYVNGDGSLYRSYNPYATTTVQHVGTGEYRINVGFQVDNRFYALATQTRTASGETAPTGASFRNVSPTALEVTVFEIDDSDLIDFAFMIVVY